MVPGYALRGSVGLNYDLEQFTSLGMYWQSVKSFTFDDAVVLSDGIARDLDFDHPENLGIGIANNRLMNGKLLLAVDILYKQHTKCAFLGEIYKDQWVY